MSLSQHEGKYVQGTLESGPSEEEYDVHAQYHNGDDNALAKTTSNYFYYTGKAEV
jgi:hypothetical protein